MVSNRLFATVNTKPCPYNCIYCFTKCDNFRKNISIDSLSNRQLYEMTKDVDIIQPACDTEFLLHPQWKEILLRLATLNKNISFATKMSIKDDDIVFLQNINKLLKLNKKILNIGVTIIKIDEYRELEPNAPTPQMRIDTLKKLSDAGISTNVIMRPIFPNLTFKEIDNILKITHNYSEGYLVGPLYINNAVSKYLQKINCSVKIEKTSPGWNQYEGLDVIYSHEIMTYIAEMAAKYKKQVFFSNEQCVLYIKEKLFGGENSD